jgi:hypothetical protein
MRVGVASTPIAATTAEPMGGYWGRDAPCEPCRDELSCRALYIESDQSVVIISLDLISISAAAALRYRKAVASACPKLRGPETVLLCCTHTHTAPQTQDGMLGFGHASESYMATLERAILSTVTAAVTQSRPALLRHVRTPPLGASINRRQRVAGSGDEDGAAAPAKKAKTSVMWFEKAGLTTLGQRPEGPTVPYADALHFVLETDGATTVATLVSFACHPVCCGKLLAQSADYVHALRSQVETATGATAVFVTGAAGDVNPLERGGGYAAADKMGRKVGDAVAAAILAAIEAANGGGGGGGSSSAAAAAVNVSAACSVVNVPLAPLPSESEALAFLEEQTAWQADKRRSSGGGGKGAGGVFAPDALPTATVSYAERVLAATKEGKGASHGTMGVAAVALGSGIALLGIEAEPFSEYALHLSSASPFPVTITVGYANGCARYLPTQAEFRLGGYEVVHARE